MNDKLKTLWGKVSKSRFKHLYIILAITATPIVALLFLGVWVYLMYSIIMLFYSAPIFAAILFIFHLVAMAYFLAVITMRLIFIIDEVF